MHSLGSLGRLTHRRCSSSAAGSPTHSLCGKSFRRVSDFTGLSGCSAAGRLGCAGAYVTGRCATLAARDRALERLRTLVRKCATLRLTVQHALCKMQHALCKMHHALCKMQHALCKMQHALQDATCAVQDATCTVQEATRDPQLAACMLAYVEGCTSLVSCCRLHVACSVTCCMLHVAACKQRCMLQHASSVACCTLLAAHSHFHVAC